MLRKNYNSFFILLLLTGATVFTSCNKKDQKVPDDISNPLTPDENGYLAATKGMKLTYTITEGDGLGTAYIWHVTEVKDSSDYKLVASELLFDGGMTVYAQGKYNKEKTISIGSNMPPLYYQLLEEMKQTFNTSFTHMERPKTMVIPHKDQLNVTVSGKITVGEWHGTGNDEDTEIQQDYSVEHSPTIIDSLGRIQIGLGTFDCVRIRYTSTAHNKMVITASNSSPQTFEGYFASEVTVWIAIGLGAIKSMDVSPAGISVTELTKIEK